MSMSSNKGRMHEQRSVQCPRQRKAVQRYVLQSMSSAVPYNSLPSSSCAISFSLLAGGGGEKSVHAFFSIRSVACTRCFGHAVNLVKACKAQAPAPNPAKRQSELLCTWLCQWSNLLGCRLQRAALLPPASLKAAGKREGDGGGG